MMNSKSSGSNLNPGKKGNVAEAIMYVFDELVKGKVGFTEALAACSSEDLVTLASMEDTIILVDILRSAGESQPRHITALKEAGFDLSDPFSRNGFFPLSTILYGYAGMLAQNDKDTMAYPLFEGLESMYIKQGLTLEAAKCQLNMAIMLKTLGKLESAMQYIELAEPVLLFYNSKFIHELRKQKLEIQEGIYKTTSASISSEAAHFFERGGKHLTLGEMEQAEQLLLACTLQAEKEKAYELKAKAMLMLGMVYNSIGQYEKATQFIRQSIPELQKYNVTNLLASAYFLAGETEYMRGDYAVAKKFFEQSAYSNIEKQEWATAGLSFWHLGKCLNELKNYNEAIKHFEEAVKFLKQKDMLLEAAKVNLSMGLSYIGIIQNAGNKTGTEGINTGDPMVMLLSFVLARNLMDDALKVFEDYDSDRDIGNYYHNMGNLIILEGTITGKPELGKVAISCYNEAISIFSGLSDERMVKLAKINLARALSHYGQNEQARKVLESIEDE